MTRPAARITHLGRFVLLACTLIGVAAMHTLGHDPSSMRPDGAHTGHATAVLAVPAAYDGYAGDDCRHDAVEPAGHGGGHLPGWQVCLAIVTAVAFAVALGVLLIARTSLVRPGPRPGHRAPSCRAPPQPRIGLHLAAVSVLRV
ncbi:DUF6153 family protein [Micromonospora endolithica]|uniref:DUF6153 family protein n=1 Tax=Micromonospora endolithica TaxID=230091 RepID=UPI0011BE9A55|nr:DUF6153 family protein [Micromonospora endolithica]